MTDFADWLSARTPHGRPGVVAVSGGPDSVALLCGLAQCRPGGLIVGHVNHLLRGEESDADAEFVRDLCAAMPHPVPAHVARIEVASLGGNLEETARRERYRWLGELARSQGASWVATGHTADDQAETVLFRVIRGTGIRGLSGIPAARPLAEGVTLVRPMLGSSREDVLDYLRQIGRPYRTDSSNADPRFTRNRIRGEILPLMRAINPAAGEAMARLAGQAAEWAAFLDGLAADSLRLAELPPAGGAVRLSSARMSELSRFLAREVFRALWDREGWPMGRMRRREWEALADVASGRRRSVMLPGGVPVRGRGRVITLGPWPGREPDDKMSVYSSESTHSREARLMGRPIRRALLSVSDKTGLVELGRTLAELGVELISTGGTRRALADAGLHVRDVSEVTGFPEILDGRVKTLHPHVHAAILAKRGDPAHDHTLQINGIVPIDLVVCNLYPFEKVTADPSCDFAKAIENIDVGGPTMIRAAAKNHAHVAVLSDPHQYSAVLKELEHGHASLSDETRRRLAAEAFARTAAYDAGIAAYLERANSGESSQFPRVLRLEYRRVGGELRSGENPHQKAALYAEPGASGADVVRAKQLHGKELSFNNYLDLDAALNLVREFDEPAAAVIKHTNPCGLATADTLADAFRLAFDGDPLSAFGGILSFNRPVDQATAEAITDPSRFIECVVAPDYEPAALEMLKGWKKNVRLLKCGPLGGEGPSLDYRRLVGGLLAQAPDRGADDPANWRCVTDRQPDRDQMKALWFAWRAVKHVKSNAIALAVGTQLVGAGAGQMSRVDSVRIACEKAGERTRGAVLASDAFFPFRDNVDNAAKAGIVAVVQPGGSQRDDESIAACNEHGLVMMFTGVRHFRH